MTNTPFRWQLKIHGKNSLESDFTAELRGVEVMFFFLLYR